MSSNAKQYGPLLKAVLLLPYIQKLEEELGDLRVDHVVGETPARKIREIKAGAVEFIGLYKADALLTAMGFGPWAWRSDPMLERAFKTPENEVFAYA